MRSAMLMTPSDVRELVSTLHEANTRCLGINGTNDSTVSGSEDAGDDGRSDEIVGDFIELRMTVTVVFWRREKSSGISAPCEQVSLNKSPLSLFCKSFVHFQMRFV